MITGDETYRRKNKKPARLALATYGLTVTSGIEDGTNGEQTIWVAKIGLGRQGSTQGLGPPEVSTLAEASPRYTSYGYARCGRSYTACWPPSRPKTWLVESPGRATETACTASPSTLSRSCRYSGRRCGSRGCPIESSTA